MRGGISDGKAAAGEATQITKWRGARSAVTAAAGGAGGQKLARCAPTKPPRIAEEATIQ